MRNKNFMGIKFRRQHIIGNYITDFVCVSKKLIIELDGYHHLDISEDDKVRTDFLAAKGYTVLRFWNNEIINNLDAISEKL